jgi:hypothetical protein
MKESGTPNFCDDLKDLPLWLAIITVIAPLNFLIFAVVASLHGGDAVNGKQEGGKYYVVSHGRYTEVSKTFFEYSRIHVYSVLITIPPALIGGIWYSVRKNREGLHDEAA